jgi:hypothetical protein
MPLRDHHHPPLDELLGWTSLHAAWATHLADNLNERWLPQEYRAAERAIFGGHPEIDVATYQHPTPALSLTSPNGGGVATLAAPTWVVPAPTCSVAGTFPDTVEVEISTTVYGGRLLVAVIEFVSPSNKDRPAERRAFAAKCAAYLQNGVSVVLIDTVTSRQFNLHNDVMRLIDAPPEANLPEEHYLYAVAYRPVLQDQRPKVDIWLSPLALNEPLPTMPLRLTGDLFVPVEFEETYMETCRRRRLL